MGSSASKAARTFPKTPSPSSLQGVTFQPPPPPRRPPQGSPSPPAPPPPSSSSDAAVSQSPPPPLKHGSGPSTASSQPGASENKTDEIHRDGSDPTYLSQLSQIGQVDVQTNSAYKAPPPSASPFTPLFTSRSADPISFPTMNPADPEPTPDDLHNRLTSAQLVDLLYSRHHARSGADVVALAERFNVDVQVLEHDLGLWICPVRPEWGLELASRVESKSERLEGEKIPERETTVEQRQMERARMRKEGEPELKLGEGRGKTLSDLGEELSDAPRVLARWRDPKLPLGIPQSLRDRLEAEQIERAQERIEVRESKVDAEKAQQIEQQQQLFRSTF